MIFTLQTFLVRATKFGVVTEHTYATKLSGRPHPTKWAGPTFCSLMLMQSRPSGCLT